MKILVVEDEKKIANFIKKGLMEENYIVNAVYNGKDALSILDNSYDLVILDINLPDINGFDLCKRIREQGYKNAVLILSVRDSVDDKVKGLDSGADDYLVKPFAFEELLARIRALSRKIGGVEGNVLKVGDLEMDLVSHKVRRAGKEIELTSKEYALLEYFMKNHDKLLTRAMILQNVWDIDFDTGTNIVDVFVRYLRKKIDDGYPKKLLHTVRGRGYILKSDD